MPLGPPFPYIRADSWVQGQGSETGWNEVGSTKKGIAQSRAFVYISLNHIPKPMSGPLKSCHLWVPSLGQVHTWLRIRNKAKNKHKAMDGNWACGVLVKHKIANPCLYLLGFLSEIFWGTWKRLSSQELATQTFPLELCSFLLFGQENYNGLHCLCFPWKTYIAYFLSSLELC